MTDRQKCVLDGIMKEFPNSFNRYCVRHMHNNFKGKFPGIKLRNCFWEAARATYSNEFKKAMYEMSLINKEAVQWVEKTPPTHWSRHGFDDSCKSEYVTNNLTKSFNSWVGEYREKPILTLLEHIRRKLMKRLKSREQKGLSWGTKVPPKVKSKIEKEKKKGLECLDSHLQGIMSLRFGKRELLMLLT